MKTPLLPQQPRPRTVASRRGFLSAGVAGGLGLSLADFFRVQQAQAAGHVAAPKPRATSVIHIFLRGGMAAQESWDPKPLAPIEYRGELASIKTKVPGLRFSDLLRSTAGVADKLTVVHSMTHGEAAHERGEHSMFTGYRPSPALQYPSLGSVVSHEFGPRKDLPPYICIPNQPTPHAGSGYLSSAFGPFNLNADPARGGYRVQDLLPPKGLGDARQARRLAALETANTPFAQAVDSDAVDAVDSFYERAFNLINSDAARRAFKIDEEPGKVRDRYGRNPAGQRMLLARRLVEAGARFVTLGYGGWDHHQNITASMRRQLPAFDRGFATLIADLDERGMLDSTIVMVSSEFGRTPKINGDGGRDHWSRVFSVALAGGGIRRGNVVGSSGPTASEPEDLPVTPEDLATTLYHQLGIAAGKELMAAGGRPIEIVKGGSVRSEIVG
ncbi:MAG: DUF1501 domain-containing protein [Planctomycetota bacterium]